MRSERGCSVLKNRKIWLLTICLLCVVMLMPSVTAEAKWVKVGKNQYRYTTNASGTKYYKKKWAKINGKYYYFDKNGYRQTGWLTLNGKKYYLNKKGVRVTGFKTIKKKKYFFSKKGVMIKGWIKSNGNYYYANSKGVIQKGLKQINNQVYYFDNNGKRVSGAHIVLGNMTYYFANNGTLQYTGTEVEKAAKYINIQRMLKGYDALTYYTNCNLSSAAYARAEELSTNASHIRPNGTNYSTILSVDYPVSIYWSGECVSWGKKKTGDVVAANWMSNNNYNVLMQEKANGISVGTYTDANGKEYWTALVVQTR